MRTDEEIRNDVQSEFKWNPRINANQIGVIVKEGAVTLTGSVETFAEKLAAERAAKSVKGVRAVAEEVEVKLPVQIQRTDEGIAEQAARLLTWNTMLRNTNIQAEVRKGRVILTGEVDWLYQKEAAAKRVGELEGVIGVFNQITIRPRLSATPRDVKREIMGALHRHANLEASKIDITVADGQVTLSGTVDAYHERDIIEEAARSTEGVRSVVDNIHVV